MQRGRMVAVLGAITAVGLLGACDPGVPNLRTGFTRNDTDDIVIIQVLCAERHVRTLELYASGDDNVIGEEGDTLLWELRSRNSRGSEVAEFVVGDAPPGFVEEQRLTADLSRVDELGVLIELDEGRAAATARVDDIETGKVIQRERETPLDEFLEAASKTCGGD